MAKYLDENGLLYYNTLKDQQLAQKAPLASPALTGTPTAPTAAAGTNTTQIATTAFVKNAVPVAGTISSGSTGYATGGDVFDAINSITGVSFEVVDSLPATGEAGVIYLVPNSGTAPNVYDEYVWLADASRFEKIGTTDVDLSGYVPTSRTINGHALTSNVSLTASDVSALPSSTTYVSSVNGSSGAVTGIQTTGNLVTSISSSSTNTQYPSAKLVYDQLAGKQATMTAITNGEIDNIVGS